MYTKRCEVDDGMSGRKFKKKFSEMHPEVEKKEFNYHYSNTTTTSAESVIISPERIGISKRSPRKFR